MKTGTVTISIVELKTLLFEHEDRIEKIFDKKLDKVVKMTLVETQNMNQYINKSQAYKLHGRAAVDRWLANGDLKQHKDGDGSFTCRLDRFELEKCAAQSNHPAICRGSIRRKKTTPKTAQ